MNPRVDDFQKWKYKINETLWLTKNDWEALAACHKTTFPSPSATPNLLPCWVNLSRFTFAKTPAGLTFWTACPWDHSHILIDPSWLPETSKIKQWLLYYKNKFLRFKHLLIWWVKTYKVANENELQVVLCLQSCVAEPKM